MVAQLRDLTLV